jgi:hypothetical protein
MIDDDAREKKNQKELRRNQRFEVCIRLCFIMGTEHGAGRVRGRQDKHFSQRD